MMCEDVVALLPTTEVAKLALAYWIPPVQLRPLGHRIGELPVGVTADQASRDFGLRPW